MKNEISQKAVNTIRFLSADAVQQANSGHPGFPMGAAAIAYTIWARHMNFNSECHDWINRDRFVLSGGHGSALLYSMLYLSGFISLDDLKSFRRWGSITPGHPEFGLTPGVDATTGPLGQGFANGVGMALAESHLAAVYNRRDFKIIDHYTYAIVTDGDLMEGVASEAASLAGHLKLGKLIYCYDDNRITIDGSTDLTFTENCAARFEAYGWQVLHVEDGNDVEAIDSALIRARADERPSLIICRTHIGYGSPHHQDKSSAHGSPLGDEALKAAKENLKWPVEPHFYVPAEVQTHFSEIAERGRKQEAEWQERWLKYCQQYPDEVRELTRRISGELSESWPSALSAVSAKSGLATRTAAGMAMNQIARVLPELMGGSADLTSSNNAKLTDSEVFTSTTPWGRNIHFGVREHAMGAIVNGMAYHQGILPYCATYLAFLDYLKPALRIAALSHLHTVWVLTHDSIFVGQDGPTHQPVEQLMSLRLIPNILVVRPADAHESFEAWKLAVETKNKPVVLILSRQGVGLIDQEQYSPAGGLQKGAYILADLGHKKPDILLMASGSEVELMIAAGKQLCQQGYAVRIVSMPCWELFKLQSESYQKQVLPDDIPLRLAVEAGVTAGWERWVGPQGKILGMDRFGASAAPEVLAEKFGFTVENVFVTALEMLQSSGRKE